MAGNSRRKTNCGPRSSAGRSVIGKVKTLVVETVSVRPGIWADLTPALLSGQQKYLERIRQVDANTLEDQMTITDPVALTKPWTTT